MIWGFHPLVRSPTKPIYSKTQIYTFDHQFYHMPQKSEIIFNFMTELNLSFYFCSSWLQEDHLKPIFSCQFNYHITRQLKNDNEPYVFATAGSNRVSVYECSSDGDISLVQCYEDGDVSIESKKRRYARIILIIVIFIRKKKNSIHVAGRSTKNRVILF